MQSKVFTFLEVSTVISDSLTAVNEGKNTSDEKRGWPNAPRNEEAQRMRVFSFILWYPGRGRATYAPVLRLSVGEG